MKRQAMTPEFPIRLIFDDGECIDVGSPEELLEKIDTLDSADGGVWIRDALDRSIALRMRGGFVEILEVLRAGP
jgi:hypothetical protein